jgi:outer membrane protein insertion porin family
VIALVACLLLVRPAAAKPFPELAREAVYGSGDPSPVVARVVFAGNHTFDDETLTLYMRTRESGLFKRIFYDRRVLIQDLANLERYYSSQGFLEAEVALDDIAMDESSSTVELLVGISEGPRWEVTAVTFSGNDEIGDDEFAGLLEVRAGGPFLVADLTGDKRRLLNEYARRSYLDARVTQRVERDDIEHTAAIAYTIVEREKAKIASIDVVGDEKTRQHVVERELTFSVGDSFDFEAIGESQANIYRTGLFNSVWIEPDPADTGRAEKRLVVRVGERASGEVDLTAGYAAIDGLEVGAGITNRNVQGQATRLSLEGRYSGHSREVRASAGDPWFLGRPVAAELALSYEWMDEEAFRAETSGGSFVLSKEFGLSVTVESGYEYERAVIFEDEGVSTSYTTDILVAIAYDTRDQVLNAHRGMMVRAEADFASSRLGGENDFTRMTLDWRGYTKLSHGRVAALEIRGGSIIPQGDAGEVPATERFYAGGEGTVRGFERDSLGPADAEGEALGGRALIVTRGEVRFPIYKKLRGAVFVDAGQVFEDVDSASVSDLVVGAGLGLRFDTRLGVLRLDAATPISERGSPHYYFGIGQVF